MLSVKFCGITRLQDARLAGALGVDAIGLIFYKKSPRYVSLEVAQQITQAVPPWVARVGVFVNEEPHTIRRVVETAGLSAVQLHGEESPEFIANLTLGVPIIKALSVVAGWPERAKRYRPLPLLLDHALPNQPGGTGTPWSWREFDPASRPDYFILAGGLNADNVKDAVDQLRPDAIDVSSGIERTPGIKDPDRMNALMHAIAPFRVSTYRSP